MRGVLETLGSKLLATVMIMGFPDRIHAFLNEFEFISRAIPEAMQS